MSNNLKSHLAIVGHFILAVVFIIVTSHFILWDIISFIVCGIGAIYCLRVIYEIALHKISKTSQLVYFGIFTFPWIIFFIRFPGNVLIIYTIVSVSLILVGLKYKSILKGAFVIYSLAFLFIVIVFTYFHWGSQYTSSYVGKWIKPKLIKEIEKGKISTVRELIIEGEDVNISWFKGWRKRHSNVAGIRTQIIESSTPLISAIIQKRADIVELLIENGADVNKQKKYSGSPLEIAVKEGNQEIIELLVEAGADLEKFGPDALVHLLDTSDIEGMTYLMNKGANVNGDIKGISYELPNYLRATFGYIEEEAYTLISYAVIKKNKEAFQLLLDHGAEVTDEDLKIVKECGNENMLVSLNGMREK